MLRESIFARAAASILLALFAVFLFSAPAAAANSAGKPSARPPGAPSRDAAFWFERGVLASTYGNYRGAIRHFDRALALNTANAAAWFARGVAWAELRELDRALADMDRALSLDPQNAHYHYGRGRTRLLAGDLERAREDLRRAAELGDEDARRFLQASR